ncbi:BREX-1 system adenine-specific DNA-methyltransferase PglX [Rhodococcus qingshengii]|uniref:BREX-1 system adenine-specific DNA-methyltransferase PglX n=1 Tax=Rhodococcus qingshengii TaxID=334542 RepID=UPI001E4796D4|nr:BREX-1 system adenine-specific DNA-methyltransferase PglX [Rhodococcus qingshengii]UGQ51170.1 BREX-1 system adenine-specific DNA-methyltransferase PglX [Rhodococcus qingshengii]
MDTKPLESFAKAARRELLVTVEARISTVLAAGSVARSERSETVRLLETKIADHGREHVIDRVAYTWFNRLIALRFMDARGYTDAGIVSPASGQAHGQPEILADAKRGDVNGEVVTNIVVHEAIIGLLDGTRRSTDAEGEAYALLLTEYCQHWHKTMPFMFEAEGAYTELLVPAGLLADGALLSRARDVLTEDVCGDVEVIGWLYQFYISERKDEVFAGFKKNGKAGAEEIPAATQLFTPHWIVRYLLENSLGRLWMLNRPTSRLVDQMDYYIAPVEEETDFLRISGPEELTVIDPACGSGHMLTYAFDLLYAIYEEEGYAPSEIPGLILTHNLHGTEIDPRAGALAAFALTMKARARDRRFFTRLGVQPKVCVIEPISFTPGELDLLVTRDGDRAAEEMFWNQFRDADVLGSLIQPDVDATAQAVAVVEGLKGLEETLYYGTLIRARKALAQADVLSRQFSVVTANPPYMGSKNMDSLLTGFAKATYPDAKSDLMTMFMKRSAALTRRGGWWGMINLPSWMSLSSFEELRSWLLRDVSIDTMLHFGRGVFGSDFGSVGFVIENRAPSIGRRGIYRRLFETHVEVRSNAKIESLFKNPSYQRFEVAQDALAGVPGTPIAYWLSDAMRATFSAFPALSSRSRSAKGLVTANNDAFVRYWWEVASSRIGFGYSDRDSARSSRKRWFPYAKGGEYRRWAGNIDSVVDWESDGRRIQTTLTADGSRVRATNFNLDRIFRPGIAWTVVTSGTQAFRNVPNGSLFDAAAGLCQSQTDDVHLGVLNSSVASEILATLNPTLNLHPGYLGLVPVSPAADSHECQENIRAAVATSQADWDDFETSWDFKRLSWFGDFAGLGSLRQRYFLWSKNQKSIANEQQTRETQNNRIVAEAYGLQDEVLIDVPLHRVSLIRNVDFRYGPGKSAAEYEVLERADLAAELISFAVGCMFGRYSLDKPGVILADRVATLQDYLAKVSKSSTSDVTFMPDTDNVIPFVDDGWFEDDVVEQFRKFLKVAFGAEHFEENLRFVEESLGVKTLRDYFITKSGKSKFYDDHVKRYKKRPIYWMFSSPNGSFNALIYLHRYTPSTVSTVLNEYLREYENKLQKAFERAEVAAAGGTSAKDQKEADRLRKVLAELRDYEHDVLYPLATQQVEIDLDDGVKVNYPKFYPAVKKIAGLEASDG